MNKIVTASRIFVVLFVSAALMTGCSGGSSNTPPGDSSANVKGPAPDNNSASNPSSADTNYQKDTGRKLSDSTRPRH